MPHTVPACPQCGLENTYPDGSNYVCPDCAFEWPQVAETADTDADAGDGIVRDAVRDANGNPLADGDAVILVKDLKVKGSSSTLKKGTKITASPSASGLPLASRTMPSPASASASAVSATCGHSNAQSGHA